MKKILNEGNQIHNFISSSGSGTVINYDSGSDFLTSYDSGSNSQKVPTVPVPVPQRWKWTSSYELMPKLWELHGPAPGRQVGLKLHQLPAAEVNTELAQVFVDAQLAVPVTEHQ